MKKRAFTLAELLMAVLVMSVMLVSMAPVITKRVTENVGNLSVTSIQKEGKLFLFDRANPSCEESTADANSVDCSFTVPADVNLVDAVVVSAGGGGAGATNPTMVYNQTETVVSSTAGSSTSSSLTIQGGMKDVTITYLSGGGGGGGGGSYKEVDGAAPTSQADCDKYHAKFVTAAQNGTSKNTCVTKYNVGDANGPAIAAGTSMGTTSSSGTSCSADACCWQGQTASSYTESGSWGSYSTTYSGKNRTVCTWYAANNSCAAWEIQGTKAGDWRLPTSTELAGWKTTIAAETSYSNATLTKYYGSNGLQLCDYVGSGYGSVYCGYYGNGCPGSYDGNCYPGYVWSGTASGSNYIRHCLGSGTFYGPDYNLPRHAFSARCVLEKTGKLFSSFGAGAGGGAPFIKNYSIPQDVIDSNVGGRIYMYAAAGGGGGAASSTSGSSATSGSSGSTSYIYVYNSSNQLKWGIKVPGGNGGSAASGSNYGSGGAQKAQNTCQITTDGSSWSTTNCSGYGASGANGTKVENSTSTATGGRGGGSQYGASSYGGGGSGGNSSQEDGSQGSRYGAGGGGGVVRLVSSGDSVTKYYGDGGKGANGVAEIEYDMSYPAAAGGGGGGGAFIKMTNISVTPRAEYTITIGGGGTGGSVSNSGTDGGQSAITFNSVSYTLLGGEGGAAGTPATSSSVAVQGAGGAAGYVNGSLVSDNLQYTNGQDGSSGAVGTMTLSGVTFNVAAGGNGGLSGIRTKGGCGGLFIDSTICTNTNVSASNTSFVAPGNLYDNSEYGSAGAGGAGGGWSENTTFYADPGGGSSGQNGYVYIWWVKVE